MKTKEMKLDSLKNNGQLQLFFIGIGSAFARTNRQNNVIIIKGDTHIMIDFGMTGPIALTETTNIPVTDITTILPTHSHSDHCGGIECMALQNRYVGIPFLKKPKLTCIVNENYQEILWDRSLRGGCEWNESPDKGNTRLGFVDFFNVHRPKWKTNQPREIWQVEYNGIQLEMFRTKHIPDNAEGWQASFVSYGLFIDEHVFFSGDTRFDKDLIDQYADKSEVMFHDVQFFPGAVHAPLADLKTLPKSITEKMLLMHYADNWNQQDISQFAGWARSGVIYEF